MAISANVTNSQISATVKDDKITASVSAGFGPQGTAGSAATVAVGSVITGAPGTSASVVNAGSSSAAVLNFTIPAGATGAQGQAGATGATGAAGAAATVSVGSVSTGAAGSSASVTNVGTSSAAVLNFSIPAGATGATGATGPQGPAGSNATATTDASALVTGTLPDARLSSTVTTALTNARTPTSHASTHGVSGSDPVTVAVSQVTGLQTALDGKQASGTYATLVSGLVPSSQLPSYVDDVIESANLASLPASGETGKIYVTLDTNKTYRWSGSAYIEISASPGSTDSVTEGSTNLYYTNARASAAAPVQSVAGRTGTVTLTKSDVGLGNVTNVDATARANHTGTQAASTITGLASVATSGSASDLSAGTLPAARIPATTVTTGSYGSASSVGTFTVGADGRLTAAGSTAIAISASAVSGLGSLATQSSVAYSSLTGTPSTFAPSAHKTSHATGGSDALTASDIGAAASSHTHAASDITSGTVATARLGSGPASSTTYLRGDGQWSSVSASPPDPYELGTFPLITISAQPSSTSVIVGQSATFSVTATATLPSATISYQWQLSTDSGSTYSDISGATSSSLSLTNLQTGSSGYRYRCKLTANLSQIFSSVVTLTVNPSFTPVAVLLTSGTSYTVPNGASTMKAWAVGGGGGSTLYAYGGQAGGCAYKTWSVSGGQAVSYVAGQVPTTVRSGYDSTVTYGGATITGAGGSQGNATSAGGYSGGDGGATGGSPDNNLTYNGVTGARGGAVGGNGASVASCGRRPMTDVSGLIAALQLAGATTSETCASTAAFGSGGYQGKFANVTPGLCGGRGGTTAATLATSLGTGGAVVLYFT